MFCLALGTAFNCMPLKNATTAMPLTKATLKKILELNEPTFTEYIVCPKCNAIYTPEYCKRSGQFYAVVCSFKTYPNHPHRSRRKECGTQLMRKVRTKAGTVYRPLKIYPYQSIKSAIAAFVRMPSFIECCELWRRRNNFRESGYLTDIYDGDIWSKHKEFLDAPYNYLLTLNIDWFSPFEHGRYSIGAIYLTILNLPISIRNKPENIILVGLIPGPNEPELTLNSFLAPLVEELNTAWTHGFEVHTVEAGQQQFSKTIRLALTCVACDIPASRKVCGFLGHRATFGCNKCYKTFKHVKEDTGSWTNYGGFDRHQWPLRTNEDHRRQCAEISEIFRTQGTQSALQAAESKKGLRYSILLDLPYFDPICCTVVDPMHNLFLGTGKHMMEVWLGGDFLSRRNLDDMERLVSQFIIPEGIGRVPSKISNHFGGFTADQWKNWITIYSSVLLWQQLDSQHWNCWILFVRAVKLLTSRILTVSDLTEADSLLLQFCITFEELYGDRHCTMNMHLHLHLCRCLQDFGPGHAFWLYAFERYNGILGSFHTNNTRIESQLVQKFLESQSTGTGNHVHTPAVDEELQKMLPKHQMYKETCTNSNVHVDNVVLFLTVASGPLSNITFKTCKAYYGMLKSVGPFREYVLPDLEVQRLKSVLKEVFGLDAELKSKFVLEFGKIIIGDDLVGSAMRSASASSSFIMAHWPGGPLCTTPDWIVGEVRYFLEVTVAHQVENAMVDLKQIFAFVHWRKPHQLKDILTQHVAYVCERLSYESCKWNYLPVHRISKRCAHITLPLKLPGDITETVTVACPVQLRLRL